MASTKNTLTSFIEESFLPGLSGGKFDDNTSFLDSGLIDSTGVLELVDFLEESFDIEVEDSELVPENLDSINNLMKYLVSKGVSSSEE
jgi:acyl carrier protein